MTRIVVHVWDDFGVIIPKQTGVWFRQQTQGIRCNRVEIEGVFIRFDRSIHTLQEIAKRNYDGLKNEIEWDKIPEIESSYPLSFKHPLWMRVKEESKTDWEVVDAPEGMPYNQEAFMWVKITKIPPYEDGLMPLIGQIVALVYPNSD